MKPNIRRIATFTLFIIVLLTFASCAEKGTDDAERYVYTDVKAIPEADIHIAYIHTDTPALEDSVQKICERFRLSKDRLSNYEINESSELNEVINKAIANGCNVFIFDEGITCRDALAQIKNNPDKFFIAYCDECGKSDNLACFEDSYLEYNYILGVLSAKAAKGEHLGILAKAPETASEYAEINSFAAGVRIVNSNIRITVSDSENTLSSDKCDAIFVPGGSNYDFSYKKAVGYDIPSGNSSISLKKDHTDFLNFIISTVTDGTFSGNTEFEVGVNYGLCDGDLLNISSDETLNGQIITIKDYFVKGMKIFSNNALMISGDEIISVTEPVIDSYGSTVIDDAGNCYYYINEELRLCDDYESLISEKMNYLYDNVEIK